MLKNCSQRIQLITNSGLGHLLIRGMLGAVFIFHGSPKFFAWFEPNGIDAAVAGFTKMGIPWPTLSVYLSGGAEFFGGIALVLGLITRPFAAILAFNMFVTAFAVHEGFDARNGGMEYPLTLAVVCTGLIFLGPGRLSLDHLLCTCCGCCKKSSPDNCKTDA